ncbi:argonaute family protein [Artemisia annua]|uniref:Argonaute family protein n=1 Tax=Artemisia annua TaxID=35608 RepID=A0A2U1PZ85_ARTAN|nr:argonaute family protein [Artemisia annua]
MSGRGGETTAPPPLMPSAARKLIVPARSEFGSAGEKIIITANHFKVDIGNIDLHQYDVTIAPEVTSKNMRRHIMESVNRSYLASPQFGNLLLAYDGNKSAFATGPLPFNSQEFVVQLLCSRGDREFKVTIKFAARKELNDLRQFLAGRQQDNPKETIRALNLVLRDKRLIVGRSLCGPFLGRGPLTDGIEYWNGFYQSLRPTQMGLSLNIDHLAGAFYEPQPLKWFVDRLLGTTVSSLTAKERIKVERAIKGVMVETEYGRRYKVQGLTVLPISQLNFIEKTGTIKTVVGYFSEKYNYELRFPAFPAIQAGTDAKPVYLPMEFCRVTAGQRYSLRLNERQVTRFLRATCQRPTIKFAGIDDVIRQMCPLSNAFEMKVPGLWTPIVARVLPPPSLCYRGPQSEVTPAAGQWTMSGLKVINGGIVEYWTIINFSLQNEEAVLDFVHELVSMCRDKGIVFKPQPLLAMRSAMPHTIEKALADLHSQASAQLARISPGRHLQMLFVILPETKGSYYSRIKRVCETELGIVSQCCKPQHIMKRSSKYFENVALKINVKVGGRNTVLSAALNCMLPYVTDRPTIIFGAYVSHPHPGEDSSPSIAAVVASMDWPEVTRYKALMSAQQHRQEIIQDLYTTRTDPKKGLIHGGMIRELLIAFKKETGRKPHRLIIYRDGVSVDQFNEVLLNEVDMIRKACISLEENYLPPVTFIVVQKRHHTRLFPERFYDRTSSDLNGNMLPGTVVDTDICHPSEFDFYLCSHAGIEGTSCPTHYHVLYDENNFTADGLQMLTNSLCYTYARCTRSVSIVPPAYYAHLAAFRARSYIGGDQYESSSCAQRLTRDRVAKVHDNVKSVMFYC